jgi:hypothetical protein
MAYKKKQTVWRCLPSGRPWKRLIGSASYRWSHNTCKRWIHTAATPLTLLELWGRCGHPKTTIVLLLSSISENIICVGKSTGLCCLNNTILRLWTQLLNRNHKTMKTYFYWNKIDFTHRVCQIHSWSTLLVSTPWKRILSNVLHHFAYFVFESTLQRPR